MKWQIRAKFTPLWKSLRLRRAVGIFSCGCKSGQEWPNLRVKLVSFPDFHQVSLCEREIEKFLLCRFLTAVAVLANIFIELILVSGIRCWVQLDVACKITKLYTIKPTARVPYTKSISSKKLLCFGNRTHPGPFIYPFPRGPGFESSFFSMSEKLLIFPTVQYFSNQVFYQQQLTFYFKRERHNGKDL